MEIGIAFHDQTGVLMICGPISCVWLHDHGIRAWIHDQTGVLMICERCSPLSRCDFGSQLPYGRRAHGQRYLGADHRTRPAASTNASDAEAELHNVAVPPHVVPAFDPDLAPRPP